MPITCLINPENVCNQIMSIKNESEDKIIIVHAFDWKTNKKKTDSIRKYFKQIINEKRKCIENKIKIKFADLCGNSGSIYCDICEKLQTADIAIFDITTHCPNVVFELGLAIGYGKNILILRSNEAKKPTSSLSDLNGIMEHRYDIKNHKVEFVNNNLNKIFRGWLDKTIKRK